MTTLFIVPWPWAGTSVACASASSTVSAIRWLVSTLPATTAEGESVDEAAGGRADRHRLGEPGVDRDVGAERDLHREGAGRSCDRERCVHVSCGCGSGALEVDLDRVAGDRDRDADRQVLVADAVALHLTRGLVAAVRQEADGPARPTFGVGDHLVERGEHALAAVPARELAQALCAESVGRRLCG